MTCTPGRERLAGRTGLREEPLVKTPWRKLTEAVTGEEVDNTHLNVGGVAGAQRLPRSQDHSHPDNKGQTLLPRNLVLRRKTS